MLKLGLGLELELVGFGVNKCAVNTFQWLFTVNTIIAKYGGGLFQIQKKGVG